MTDGGDTFVDRVQSLVSKNAFIASSGLCPNKTKIHISKIASGIEILDTPGTLWPVFDNNQVAHHLAYIGSIKEEVLDVPSLSLDLIRDLIKIDKQILISRYNIEICAEDEPINVLEKICVARGFLLKKGELDYDRGAFAILNDFKQNRMGKISLEKTSDIKQLLIKNRKPENENKN